MEEAKRPVVLMADDDEDDCMLAKDAFKQSRANGTLYCVEDGTELLDYLTRSSAESGEIDNPLPSLILLDLNMPRKSGRQALVEIKSVPAFRDIPIVVFTTSREKQDIIFCREMGAEDFITKPALFSEWVKIMKSLARHWIAGSVPIGDC